MKALIVYYSHTGNTEEVSSALEKCLCAKEVDCHRMRIISDSEKNKHFFKKIINALSGKTAPIDKCSFDPDEYDFIFLGTPVWAAQPTPSVNAFLQDMPELHGQKVCPFVTMGSMGDKLTIATLKKKIEAKGGCFHAALSLKMDQGFRDEHVNSIEHFIKTQVMVSDSMLH